MSHVAQFTLNNCPYTNRDHGRISSVSNICGEQYVGSAWDELKHIRQAVGFLVRIKFTLLMLTWISDLSFSWMDC